MQLHTYPCSYQIKWRTPTLILSFGLAPNIQDPKIYLLSRARTVHVRFQTERVWLKWLIIPGCLVTEL